MKDLVVDLRDVRRRLEIGAHPPVVSSAALSRRRWWIAAAIAAVVVAGLTADASIDRRNQPSSYVRTSQTDCGARVPESRRIR